VLLKTRQHVQGLAGPKAVRKQERSGRLTQFG
jgi:hypothetical protein